MPKFLSCTAIALALAVPAWAQANTDQASDPVQLAQAANAPDPGQLMGKTVQTSSGETIGQVSDILWGANSQVAGIVVDAGSFLGTQPGHIALDWDDVTMSPGDQAIVADLNPEMMAGGAEAQAGSGIDTGTTGMTTDTSGMESETELPDISESQPGVITGEDVQVDEDQPDAGRGTTDSGDTGGFGDAAAE
jgi:sporulation protein YlmC with PRC-barrel domain